MTKDFNEDVSDAIYRFPETDTGKTIATFFKKPIRMQNQNKASCIKESDIYKLKKIKLFFASCLYCFEIKQSSFLLQKKRGHLSLFFSNSNESCVVEAKLVMNKEIIYDLIPFKPLLLQH